VSQDRLDTLLISGKIIRLNQLCEETKGIEKIQERGFDFNDCSLQLLMPLSNKSLHRIAAILLNKPISYPDLTAKEADDNDDNDGDRAPGAFATGVLHAVSELKTSSIGEKNNCPEILSCKWLAP
jgi:hypothetical protein